MSFTRASSEKSAMWLDREADACPTSLRESVEEPIDVLPPTGGSVRDVAKLELKKYAAAAR